MQAKAYAKINWALNVTGQRADGYHLLDMLVQRISLCDELNFTKSSDMAFSTEGSALPLDKDNLVVKAALALKAASGTNENAHIHLKKMIPSQAGLGGGSADAAATLQGLNALWKTGLSNEELAEIGVNLGADVPLCLYPGLMRVKGIGEIIEEIDNQLNFSLIILQPDKGLSTADIFRAYDQKPDERQADINTAMTGFVGGQAQQVFSACHNQLQATAAKMLPAISEGITALYYHQADFAQMTGSGSCVFGVFSNKEKALLAKEALKDNFPVCILAQTRG